MIRRALLVMLLLALVLVAAAQAEKWAIVVGINQYPDPGIPDLKYAVQDAKLVHKVLTDARAGFPAANVMLLTDDQSEGFRRPTLSNIIRSLSTWFAEPAAADGYAGAPQDGYVTIGEAQSYAAAKVEEWSRVRGGMVQTPSRSKLDVSGGEMVLATCQPGASVPPPPAAPPTAPTAPVAAEPEPGAGPALPEGCSWLKPPEGGCPVDDAKAYQEWVRQNGPIAVKHERSGISLVWVPHGQFMMGSESGDIDEEPVHAVELDGFWIGVQKVTTGQWHTVMGTKLKKGKNADVLHTAGWRKCQEFCDTAGLKLPTEAQWEYAARGPDSREFPWGDEWVASLAASPAGASWCGTIEMVGAFQEWCRDNYQKTAYESAETPRRNPVFLDTRFENRVIRGSHPLEKVFQHRASDRKRGDERLSLVLVGFRVVLGP